MDSVSIAALATDMSQARFANEVQMAVLKKAIDASAQGALQLIEAAAQVVPGGSGGSVNPPNLGNAVDVFA